jgi:hypothetical protein
MDPMGRVMIVASSAIATAYIARTVVNAIVRIVEMRQGARRMDQSVIAERLERIEVAVDAIAIEVERLGEHHRFNAQLALGRPEPLPAKVITPH